MHDLKASRNKKVPIWLRNLHQVHEELQSERWPSQREGFHQALILMSRGLESLHQTGKAAKLYQLFSEADARWIRRWKKEREAFIPKK